MKLTAPSWCFLHLHVSDNSSIVRLQEDEKYEQSGDVRAQLKFFDQLDHLEKQRKEEQEREILLKAAKVQSHEHQTLK